MRTVRATIVKNFLKAWIVSGFISLNSLNAQELITDTPLEAGNSQVFTRNINHPNAKPYQRLKKGVCILYWYSTVDKSFHLGSGFLVNTVDNSFENDKQKIYLMTVDHNNFPIGDGVPKDKKKEIYLSFDYESANPNSREESAFAPEEYASIQRLWRLQVKSLVRDPDADLALYEIVSDDPTNPWTIKDSPVYKNTFALGWTLHPALTKTRDIVQIGHPSADLKKFLRSPESFEFQAFQGFNTNFIEISVVPNQLYSQQKGSSGSPVFDKNGRVFAVASHSDKEPPYYQSASLLENLWYRENWIDMMKYLDPQNTWISTIPGGYLEGLIPHNTDFNLEVEETPKVSSVLVFSASDFFGFTRIGQKREKNLADGLILSGTNNDEVYLTFYPAMESDRILYGCFLDDYGAMTASTLFEGKSWETNEGEFPIPPSPKSSYPGFNNDSKMIKAWLLKYLRENNSIETTLKNFQFEGQLKIQSAGTSKVTAVKLPNQMPYNAVELFEPQQLENIWKHYDYHPSRGKSGKVLNISQITYQQADVVPKHISTDNNGGYLNLVNVNYKLGPIKMSSDALKNNLKLTIDLYNPNNESVSYAVWIDYYNGDVFGGKQEIDHTYNFVYDPAIHEVELFASGTHSGSSIVLEEEMPDVNEISLLPGETRLTRMRISVKKGAVPPTQGEIFNDGEVEDYLIELVAPTNQEIVEATESSVSKRAHLTGRPSADLTCDNSDEAPADDLEAGTHDFGLFEITGCPSGDCYNTSNKVTYGSSIAFVGSNILQLDQCNAFISQAFAERTVAMWIYPTENGLVEMLYDEGGAQDGLAIRLNNGMIEAQIASNGQELRTTSNTSLVMNQWHHIMVVYDDGKLLIYQNDDPAIETDGSSSFTSIPDHSDPSAVGGSLGTNAFGETPSNFTGLVNNVIIWNYAVPITYALAKYRLYYSGTSSSARLVDQEAQEEAQAESREPVFSVFPNPASDQVNIILDIIKSGTVQIALTDLQGRLVYERALNAVSNGIQWIKLGSLGLPSGSYLLSVTTDQYTRQHKLIMK